MAGNADRSPVASHRVPLHPVAIWAGLGALTLWTVAAAANSPLLAWRDPIYVAAGFAGIAAFLLLLMQPLLATGALPGLHRIRQRRLHAVTGGALILAVAVHVAGLWITSPPDVVDALLLRSPTPFSVWGVVAMWAAVAAAGLARGRRRLRRAPRLWTGLHLGAAALIVGGTIAHALLIEGTMGSLSKYILCAAVGVATLHAARQALLPPPRRG